MDSKEVIKKYRKSLLFFYIIVALFVAAMIIVLNVTEGEKQTVINILLLVGLLLFVILYKNIILGYKNMSEVARLNLNQGNPIEMGISFDKIQKKLINNEYVEFSSNHLYDLYYQIGKKPKNKELTIVATTVEERLDFYDKNLHDEITKIEDSLSKKNRYYEMIIIVFKKYENVNKENAVQIGEIVNYGFGKKKYVQINVGYSIANNKAYFLYSDLYYPNRTYKKAVEEIKQLIK